MTNIERGQTAAETWRPWPEPPHAWNFHLLACFPAADTTTEPVEIIGTEPVMLFSEWKFGKA